MMCSSVKGDSFCQGEGRNFEDACPIKNNQNNNLRRQEYNKKVGLVGLQRLTLPAPESLLDKIANHLCSWYRLNRASDISRGLGAAKSTKTRKILRNSVEILSNTCLYNIFETYFSYTGYLLAVNLQIYLGTSSLKRANNVPKLPGVDYVAKNWALAMMLKALPLVHFWSVLLLKEQMTSSVRKTLKMLV